MKVMWNGREVEIPPTIEKLLKKRGWSFPPTEEMKRGWREAGERSAGSLHTPPEVWEELAKEDHVLYHLFQMEKKKEKRDGNACSTSDIS